MGGYWAQATQSNTVAGNTIGVASSANFFDGDYAVTHSASYSSSQNYLTDVGAYGLNSDSAYGINDQAGNVFEWNDAVISGSSRGLRGGAWNNNASNLPASNRNNNTPTNENNNVDRQAPGPPQGNAGRQSGLKRRDPQGW